MIGLLTTTMLSQAAPTAWSIGYIAQGVRPGARVGLEWTLLESEKNLSRRDEARTTTRKLLVEPALQGWYHWGNHTPLTASGQLIYRRTSHRGWSREVLVGQGATYANNAGLTYSFDDSGALTSSRLAGQLMSATSLGLGIGHDTAGATLAWHLRPTLTVWAPYTSGIAPVATIELGLRRAWGGAQ